MVRVLMSLKTTAGVLLVIGAVLGTITVLEAREGTDGTGSTFHLYGSWWLFVMLAMLFTQLSACLGTRRLLRAPALLAAHAGLGLLLVGAFLTARGSERGMVYLAEGEVTNLLRTPGRLGVEVARGDSVVGRTPLRRVDRVQAGATYALGDAGTATLIRFLPSSRVRNVLRPRDDEIGAPGVSLYVPTPHGSETVVLAEGWAEDAQIGDVHLALGPPEPMPRFPLLVIRGDSVALERELAMPEDIGDAFEAGRFTATILDYSPDFKVGAARSDGPPVNPALRVALASAGAASETLWVFSKFPGFARPRTPGLTAIEFTMPSGSKEALNLYHVEGMWRFRHTAAGTETDGACAEGDTFFVFATPSVRIPLVVQRLLSQSEVVPEVESAPEAPTAPAAVQLTFASFEEPVWLIEGGPEVVVPGSDGELIALSLTSTATLPFWLALDDARREDYPNSAIPRVYESVVRIGPSPDSVSAPVRVRTNSPARYRGWRIYQSEFGADADDDVEWSGFQVARDPGATAAFAGVLAVTLGLFGHIAGIGRRAMPVLVLAMVAAPGVSPADPLSHLVVSHEGRLKPLETLARDVELELGVTFAGDPVAGLLDVALHTTESESTPLITVDEPLASALGLASGRGIPLVEIQGLRSGLERIAAARDEDIGRRARALLGAIERLGTLEDLIAIAPGTDTGSWWVPPTQAACPAWAVQRWASFREHYRAARTREAGEEARALVREQRARLGQLLPAPLLIALEVWWRRVDPPRWLLWWATAWCLVHGAAVAAGARSRGVLLLPIAMVAGLNAAAVVSWATCAGRLPLLNSWEVYFLVLALVPVLGLAVHCGTGLHHVSAAALVLTLIGGIGLRFLPASARIVRPPVAILQSGWREVHILSTMTAYACLFLVAGLCAALLVRPAQREIERLARRILLVGIWLLGVGIATGAAWAHEAWGRYWGWDPKEVWALVAWLVFVGAAHARAGGAGGTRGWAVLVILGFAALLFTFLGVTFLLPGLHSYG